MSDKPPPRRTCAPPRTLRRRADRKTKIANALSNRIDRQQRRSQTDVQTQSGQTGRDAALAAAVEDATFSVGRPRRARTGCWRWPGGEASPGTSSSTRPASSSAAAAGACGAECGAFACFLSSCCAFHSFGELDFFIYS
jgi:hypothetical protein